MNVRELIARLQELPPELEVCIVADDSGHFAPVNGAYIEQEKRGLLLPEGPTTYDVVVIG